VRNRPNAPHQRELTPRQRSILMYGDSGGLTGRGFLNEQEALGQWMAHRGELLKESGSSRGRPHAYLKYELCETEPEWVDDILELYRRGLLPAPREENVTLTADQGELHREFESAESVRKLGLPTPMLEGILREFGNVLAYHRYRGRVALIAKYEAIHSSIRQVLRESLIPLKKESIQ
jgi:hypothetical protein